MGPGFLNYLVFLAALLGFSFLFSLAETAFTATSTSRIYKMKDDDKKKVSSLMSMLNKKEDLISSILIGNNIANILASSIATYMAIKYFGDDYAIEISTAVMTIIIIFFCEVLPKTIAINSPERISLGLSPIFFALQKVLRPLLILINLGVKGVCILLPLKNRSPVMSVTELLRSEIEFFHENGSVVKNDKDMLDGVLVLNEIEVQSIMTPKKNVCMINITDSFESIVDTVLKTGHTRIPVYKQNQDEIIGILHAKELMSLLIRRQAGSTQSVSDILFKPYFISANTKVKTQLLEFKKTHNHIALVADEYGNMIGILTLEDIIEEIVGNIQDEHDVEDVEQDFMRQVDGAILVRGDYQIRDFNRETGLEFSTEEYSTVAGLVIDIAEKIPEQGEKFEIMGHHFEVLQKHGAKIDLLKVTISSTLNNGEGLTSS